MEEVTQANEVLSERTSRVERAYLNIYTDFHEYHHSKD
jgi:hypothetical protein